MKHALNRGRFSKVVRIMLFDPILADPLMFDFAIGYGEVCTMMPLVFSACKALLFISSNCFTLLFCSLLVTERGGNVYNFEFLMVQFLVRILRSIKD